MDILQLLGEWSDREELWIRIPAYASILILGGLIGVLVLTLLTGLSLALGWLLSGLNL